MSPSPAAAEGHWLPDFCSLPVIAATMLVAELVLLLIMLAPSAERGPEPLRLLAGTAFVQWLALIVLVSLCRLRPLLVRRAFVTPTVVALALVSVVVAGGSGLVFAVDQALDFHLTLPRTEALRFVLGNTGIALLVSGGLFRYFYVRAEWQRQVHAQAKAQSDALAAKLRPHFLFNTLNAIASLVRSRPEQAEQAIENLSDLLRASLKSTDQLSTLQAEFELVDRYLEIEALRLGERLRITRRIDGQFLACPCPALLLQPLVENAILHGIAKIPAGGELEIELGGDATLARARIRNPVPTPAPTSGGHHIGLSSVKHRLAWHFGDRARLSAGASAGYYDVVLELPRT